MALIQFTKNYTDRSNDTGFQFEFHCDKCGNGFMSAFQTSSMGVASSLLKAAGSLFGGSAWNVANAGDHVKDMLRGSAWDAAYKTAVDEGKQKFKLCTKCGRWVCPEVCWNHDRGLCEECAPNLAEHAASIQAQVAVEQTWEKARGTDQTQGLDVKAPRAATCAKCGATLTGGKFCGECGTPVAQKVFCTECGAERPPTAKFCPGCGAKAG